MNANIIGLLNRGDGLTPLRFRRVSRARETVSSEPGRLKGAATSTGKLSKTEEIPQFMLALHDYLIAVGPNGKMRRFAQFSLTTLIPEVLDFR
jgi:hypothetical protein